MAHGRNKVGIGCDVFAGFLRGLCRLFLNLDELLVLCLRLLLLGECEGLGF